MLGRHIKERMKNIEHGIKNVEVCWQPKANFDIQHSVIDIRHFTLSFYMKTLDCL